MKTIHLEFKLLSINFEYTLKETKNAMRSFENNRITH